MAKSPKLLTKIQMGLESSAGTAVPATYLHFGNGTWQPLEMPNQAGFEYAAGYAGGFVEGTFIADAGSRLNLSDTPFAPESMVWLGNMAIKTALTSASADTPFAFTFPSTSANSISTFTWEFATATQEYEFTNGICSKFSIHGDVTSNNGKIFYNAVIEGRASSASTATGSLGFIPNLVPGGFLNINAATLHFDAVGTAGGTASATAAVFRGFSIDVETGWELRKYGDGRAAKDGSLAVWHDYQITGTVKFDLDSAVVTRIANARAGTPEIMAIKMNGASSRLVTIVLPISWSELNELGGDDGGIMTYEMPFRAGYSYTTTAQAPSITVLASAAITVT